MHPRPAAVSVAWGLLFAALSCGDGGRPTDPSPSPQPAALALVGGTLIDGRGGEPLSSATVVTRGDRIEAAGATGTVSVPPDARIVDLAGSFVLPGFINVHVHNAINTANLKVWARAGVTTVRDVGARESAAAVFAFRAQAASDPANARLVAAGPIVTVPGGYPMAYWNFPALPVTSAEDARTKVAELAAQGADLVKIALEPGDGSWPMLSEDEVRAIVETAHARGLPVSAHLMRASDLAVAVDLGLDDAAHVPRDPVPDAVIERMVARGVALVPTLAAVGRGGDNVRRFAAAGGLVALGNDGGYLEGLEVGMPLRELRLLADNGLSPMQVILSATHNAARVCRREALLGTLEPGKAADVLVVRRNPLADLAALGEVRLVVHDGAVIRRDD